MTFGISFDFWNTLYGNGDEPGRHEKRVEYFHNVVSKYINIDRLAVENAFLASTKYFVHEWQNKFRTPTAKERLRLMSKKLSVELSDVDIDKIVDFFGNLIFSIPPESNSNNLKIVRQLAENFPIALISDTGYISGKYIRRFLDKQEMSSCFDSLIFSDEQTHCKPHSSLFEQTCKNLNVSCSNLIHIGDLEKTDIRGARESGGIGIRYTGWIAKSKENSLAHYVVDNYQELSQTISNIVNS